MNIVVLLKQTFDTEEKISILHNQVNEAGVQFIMNPYDEYAVEEAIKIKEEHGGTITVISVGPQRSESALRTALAMGADHAVLVETEDRTLDEYSTSTILANVLKDRPYDIVFGGNFSIDNGSGQVCVRVAELLEIPQVTSITKLEIQNGLALVHRDVEGDLEIVEAALPVLVTAQQGLNEPRYPSLPNIMKAKKKTLDRFTIDDLTVTYDQVKEKTAVIEIYLPTKKTAGRLLTGTVMDQTKELARIISMDADAK